jgi:peptide/nickel transport system substrate-binding protein
MRGIICLAITVLMVLNFLMACAAPAPTAAPTKPSAPAAATTAPPQSGATSAPVAKVKRGGTLLTADNTEPKSFDPAIDTTNEVAQSVALEGLLSWTLTDNQTGKHELKPWLAQSWEMPDPKTITFKLRPGVKFHDGSDFNAEVVKWHFERMRTDAKSTSKGLFAMVDSTTVVDPTTFKFNLKSPSASFLQNLTGASGGTGSSGAMIISKTSFDTLGEQAIGDKAVGTGPFVIEQWKRDYNVTYKKWDQYWKKGVDGLALPYVDRQEHRKIPDSAVGVLELRSGGLHVYRHLGSKDIATIQSDPQLQLVMMPWAARRYMVGFWPTKSPFGTNLKLRQASQHAIDRESMAKTVGLDAVAAYYSTWVPGFPGYDEKTPKPEFNLDKAKQLIQEAGYSSGIDVEVSFQKAALGQIPEITQAMWGKIGIRAKLTPLDDTAFLDIAKGGNLESVFNAPTASPDPDNYTRAFASDGTANWWHYSNPAMDKCLEEGRVLYDFDKRHEVYKRCLNILQEDSLTYGLINIAGKEGHRKEVKNITTSLHLVDTREAWLDK